MGCCLPQNRSITPACSSGCGRHGPGRSPQSRGVGSTLPGLHTPSGSNAARAGAITVRSESLNIFGIEQALSLPTPFR